MIFLVIAMFIPKVIHFIWAGGGKVMPVENIKTMLSWQAANPTFKICLWVDHQTDVFSGLILFKYSYIVSIL